MKTNKIHSLVLALVTVLLVAVGCDRNALTGSKLTRGNYDQNSNRMTKAQVEKILGPPTTTETKDMVIFKKRPNGTKRARNSP
jgi:outer membrane protein assembly factor BamE (lipoprotein component of BamABCDE complex)